MHSQFELKDILAKSVMQQDLNASPCFQLTDSGDNVLCTFQTRDESEKRIWIAQINDSHQLESKLSNSDVNTNKSAERWSMFAK